jgi:type 1 glutamine amidotransferase
VNRTTRRALVVRGGWDGHHPVEATDLFIPGLAAAGFEVIVSDTLEIYADDGILAGTDLVVGCWTDGELTAEQSAGLLAAVHAGTGFAGWHGGIVGAFCDRDYLRMTGGVFVHHPEHFTEYDVVIGPDRAAHPIVDGLTGFTITTEQYWMLTDVHNEVLATSVCHGPGGEPVPMPVVWTRAWGAGRVFVSALGHSLEDLRHPTVYAMTLRGLLWAARAEEE